jgi:hypothetical protein
MDLDYWARDLLGTSLLPGGMLLDGTSAKHGAMAGTISTASLQPRATECALAGKRAIVLVFSASVRFGGGARARAGAMKGVG